MGFRFWRRIRLVPGITMNLSKSGASLSFGPRGAKVTVGGRGSRATVGAPGTGMFYTQKLGGGRGGSGSRARTARPTAPKVSPEQRLSLGFFQRLWTAEGEEAFVDGARELVRGNHDGALEHFRRGLDRADNAFLAGFVSLKRGRPGDAAHYLVKALENERQLGVLFDRYGLDVVLSMGITPEVTAHMGPNRRGALLGLTEAYQELGEMDYARQCLERLSRMDPGDPFVKVSLAEVLLEAASRKDLQRIVKLSKDVENESTIHAALLLYKGRALDRMGLHTAARDAYTAALRRKKDRPEDLLRVLRYERALIYEKLGRKTRSRRELEKIYAEAPGFEDVAQRLGLK